MSTAAPPQTVNDSDPTGDTDIRALIREDLPADAFERRPARALGFVPIVAIIGAGTLAIVLGNPAWYLALAIAVVLGNAYAAGGLLAHETLHGSQVRSVKLQNFLGYLGLGPFLVSPHLWRVWHNQVHHGKTNKGNLDPDGFGTMERFEKAPSTRWVARLAPGSGKPRSAFFFAYWFTFHGQIVLWIQTRMMLGFRRVNRRRAKIDTFVAASLWLALAVWAGPVKALFVMVIPMILANAITMSYIATNHFMRPQTTVNDPLENSMSVTTWRPVDRVHSNFSHHVEHHLFPNMSGKFAPDVRRWLQEHEGDRYVAPAHAKAVAYLYRTPRIYLDDKTLVNPDDPRIRADTDELVETLA